MADHDDIYDRPLAYEDEDGRIVYRASALGGCDGALVRARLGVTGAPPSDFMQTRFDEGTDWEARVLERGLEVAKDDGLGDWLATQDRGILELHGRVVEAAGDVLQVETEVAWGNKVVRCHPDGILVSRDDLRQAVCEVKFLGPDMAAEKIRGIKKDRLAGLGDSYAWQAAIEMLSTGLPMLYIIGWKSVTENIKGERVVTIGDVDVFWFDVDDVPFSLKDVKARVLGIEGHVTRGTMPACPVPLMYPCPYWAEHEKVEKAELDDAELVHLLESYGRNAVRREAMDTEQAEIRKSIQAAMTRLGVTGGRCAGWDVAVMQPRPGNVSWGKAYKALAKMTKQSVNEDEFRGAEVAGGVRIGKVKDNDE